MSQEHSKLLNSGLLVLNPEAIPCGPGSQMTLLVLGAPRGGTSAIAGALAKLEVFMGDGAAEPVFEGLKLARAMEDGTREDALALIETYNQRHPIWAHKRPGFTRLVQDYHTAFRNPVYLVIMRDPVATASRGVISGRLKGNYLKKLRQILEKYEGIINFVETTGAPAVFISYEKLLQEPRTVLEQLLGTLGLPLNENRLEEAVRFVEPSPSQYLEVSRSNRTRGAWERFDEQLITGWAEYVNRTMTQPPRIVLYDGDREISRTAATGSGDHKDRGFEFDLKELRLKPGPNLRVRPAGEIRDFPPPAFSGSGKLRFSIRSILGKLSRTRGGDSR